MTEGGGVTDVDLLLAWILDEESKFLLGSVWKKYAAFDLRTLRGVVPVAACLSTSLGDGEKRGDPEATGEEDESSSLPNSVNITQSKNLPGSLTLRTEGNLE